MLNHILIPLDGSELVEDILDEVQGILDTGGYITLVAAVNVPSYKHDNYPAVETRDLINIPDLVPGTKEYLECVATTFRSAGYTVDYRVILGDPVTVIVETAHDSNVDAILISQGYFGLNRWVFSRVAIKVLSVAPCPIFVIPSEAKWNEEVSPKNYYG